MKISKPFISVVIPTCNRQETLITCVESIRANNYEQYEIIVVDQSDTNETHAKIMEMFNLPEVVYVRSYTKCSSDSRNRGWEKARGEIVAFTDDDAQVGKSWLEAYASAFGQVNARVGVVGGRVEPVFEIPRPPWLPSEKDYLLPGFNAGADMKAFPSESLPMSVNFALRREVLVETGGFDTRLGLKEGSQNPHIGGEDSFLSMKVKERGYSILYQPSAVVYHPIAADRLTRRFFLKRNFREGVTAIALENAKNICKKHQLSSHIKWHLKRFVYYGLLLVRDVFVLFTKRSNKYMLRAAEMAYSAGAIHHARHLQKNL
jgi:GT2 family glycosyltransferase